MFDEHTLFFMSKKIGISYKAKKEQPKGCSTFQSYTQNAVS